ncbi:MAG: APC family permease [Acidimicrobiales bacterium]
MAISTERAPVGSFEDSDRHLRKSMGFNSLLFMGVGAIIGSGWLFGSLDAANLAGPASIISWAIGGIFIIFVALPYAEVAGMLPRTGAVVRYPQMTHGAYTGWILGWTYWIDSVAVPAIEAEAAVTYVGSQFPGVGFETKAHGVTVLTLNGIGFAIGLMALFFVLNFFGARLLGEWNRWFTWWKIIIPIVTFCFLFAMFNGSNLTSYPGGFFAFGTTNVFVAMPATGVVFAFLGFRQPLDYAGESKNPQRDVPIATILAVVIGIVIYVGLQIGFLGGINWGSAGITPGNWHGLAASKWGGAPLFDALQASGIGSFLVFSQLLLVDGGISPSATGWIYIGTGTRTGYGLSVNGYAPKALRWYNKWGIPWIPLIIAFVVGCLFFIPAPSWYRLVGFITSATALTYIMGGMSLSVFRKHAPDLYRPFRLGMSWFWAPVGFLAAALLVFWTVFGTLANIYGAVFLGLPLFAWYYVVQRDWVRPMPFMREGQAKAVPAYVLGLVYLGGWGYLSYKGGWVLRVVAPHPGSWSFGTYDIALSAAVIFFCVALWAISKAEGRKQVTHTAWLIFLLLAMFPLNYFTAAVGPLKNPPLEFRWGTLIAVGVGLIAYYWGVQSGFMTDELRQIVESARGQGQVQAGSVAPAPGGVGPISAPRPGTSTMTDTPPPGSSPGGSPATE